MKFSSKLRRTILCLPFILAYADHSRAALVVEAAAESGAQRVTLPSQLFEQCSEFHLRLGEQLHRITCDRLVSAPGVRFWEGHVADSTSHKLNFQIRAEGTTGLLDLPDRPLQLGLVDGAQWLLDTPAEQLRAELDDLPPPLFVLREAVTIESAQAAPQPNTTAPQKADANVEGKPADVAYPVALNLTDLAAVQPGGQVDLALPGLQQNITYEKTVVSPEGTSTWIGYLTQYGPEFPVVLTYGVDGTTTGAIQGPSGEWLLTGKAGETWLIDTASSGLRHNPEAKDGDAIPPPMAGAQAEALVAGATATSGTTSGTTASAETLSGNTVVDVLVLYTPGLATRYGGDAGVVTRIDHFISLANQAYSNGSIGITLRRVGLQRIDLADNTSNSTTLGQLRTSSGVFASIPALRNSTGADGVLLVRPFDMAGQGGNCGVGYIGGYGGSSMSGYAEYAYAVVSEGSDTKGLSYYCTDTTFAHELGHNMGLMHDRATVASQGGGSGALPYAFGYGRSGQFGTIMSYIHPVVTRFSNPRDTACTGGTCGIDSTNTTSSADNAKALGITRTPFSSFRATTTAGQVSVAGVITIDGKAAANVRVLADGTQCAVSSSTGAYACRFAAGWSGTISVAATNTSFTPPTASYTDLQTSASRNFTGLGTTVAIRGTATVDGKLTGGIAVLAGSTSCGNTTTTGTFTCRVERGWSGNISGSSTSATFRSIGLTSVAAAQTVSLVGTSKPVAVTIRGTVRINGLVTAGVTVSATGATCTATNINGNYACTLMTHGTGTVSATFKGTTFTPLTKSFSNILVPLTQNFDGVRPRIAISGTVTVAGRARSGATVNAGGALCGVTNTLGQFTCSRPKAWSGKVDAPALSSTVFRNIDNLIVPTRADLAIP